MILLREEIYMVKLPIEMSGDLLFETASLVYNKWNTEYKILQLVKEERNDGTRDWHLFHDIRLKDAIQAEEAWRIRKNEITAIFAGSKVHEEQKE